MKDRRAYYAAYYLAHRKEKAQSARDYYGLHREERIAYQKAYRTKHRKEYNAYLRAYKAAHPKETAARAKAYYETHRDERMAYRRSVRGKLAGRAGTAKYAALKRQRVQVAGDRVLTRQQWEKIVLLSKGKCYWCRKKMKKVTQDHVIPLSKGGAHTAENIVASCHSCNCRKHAKIVTLF